MSDLDVLIVNDSLTVPRAELRMRASRAGGAGGQHVNTSSTRVELLWDLERSRAIDDATRDRLRTALAKRIDAEGLVRVVASAHRSQLQNRVDAERRLAALLRRALTVPKVRRATKPTRASIERRIVEKKRRSDRKRDRRPGADD
jgi:ribosome-associated protein